MALPVYEMVINPDESSEVEVSFVALVDKPAIEKNFLAFNKALQFAINEEKRIISGPAMIANQLIYRKDTNGEYNVFFSPETIREIAIKFFKKDYQKNINLFHDPNLSLDGVTIFESFVSDAERGISPMKGFEDSPDGTWFISAKVENDEVWNKIKSGEVKGFSVEGIFSFMQISGTQKHNSHLQEEISFMSEIKDLWNQFKEKFLGNPEVQSPAAPVQLTEATLKDGTVVTVDKLEVGGVVKIGDAPAHAGVHELSDGTKITVGEGGVIEAVEKEEAPDEEMQKPTDYSDQFAAIEQRFADLNTSYEAKFSEQATQLSEFAEKFNKANETITSLVELVGKIIETPTADSVVGNKNNFSTQKTESKADRVKDLAKILNNLKNK